MTGSTNSSIRNTIKRLFPSWLKPLGHSFERSLVRFVRFFTPGTLPQNPDGKIYLNLGAGSLSHPAFINIDALPAWSTHYIRSITNLSNFSDNSVDMVYASHCLEHISHSLTAATLREWRRVLKPGGVLRIGVPNFDSLLRIYHANGHDIEMIQGILCGGQDYPLNVHLRQFTDKSLTQLFKDVGFERVQPWQYGADAMSTLNDCAGMHVQYQGQQFPISLNLEAIK
jgi:predicted SAM-dependent methyltransferase